MKKIIPEISIIVLFAFLNMLAGCSYYHVNTLPVKSVDKTTLYNTLEQPRYFILHQGQHAWHMNNINVNEDKQEISCTTSDLPPDHLFYMSNKPKGVNRYHPKTQFPIYEVHIYIDQYAELNDSLKIIPLGDVSKIEVYDKDAGATTASWVFGSFGIVIGVLVVILVIAALMKSSCPFIYISDGVSYHFTGEMYGGAIYAPLERDDFMPLPGLKPVNSKYQLKISNELLERQYTDLAELLVVQHPLGSKIIIDKNGEIQSVTAPVSALKAYSDTKEDYAITLASVDSNSFLFNESGANENDFSTMTMEFKKPLNAGSGKLILHAKNSFWLDYVYGKFNELFGTSFNKFSEKQKTAPAERMKNWQLSQGIPLSVYIETADGWQFVDYFNPVGPLASRELVMPVDVSKVKGDQVKIRLQSGFMFWEVDYAAMDFTENIPVKVDRLLPESAIDEKGLEVSATLKASDKQYLVQTEAGNEVIVNYRASTSAAGYQYSSFLHSRGYYEYIRDYKNEPDISYLLSFRKEGAFARFSKEKYLMFASDKDLITNALTNDK